MPLISGAWRLCSQCLESVTGLSCGLCSLIRRCSARTVVRWRLPATDKVKWSLRLCSAIEWGRRLCPKVRWGSRIGQWLSLLVGSLFRQIPHLSTVAHSSWRPCWQLAGLWLWLSGWVGPLASSFPGRLQAVFSSQAGLWAGLHSWAALQAGFRLHRIAVQVPWSRDGCTNHRALAVARHPAAAEL